MANDMPAHPRISIIGGGLAGLTLSRCLRHHGIPSIIFEKDSAAAASKRYNYGITLWSAAYSPLLNLLGLDDADFRREVAVDAGVGGVGRVGGGEEAAFRANRMRVEGLLREGLDIRWEHALTDIESADGQNTLHFRDGTQVPASSMVVGAEGPHSPLRKLVSPSTDFRILPYAVYNGKRRLSRQDFDVHFAAEMRNTNVIEARTGQALLQISLNDVSDDGASVSYTYSRPAVREGRDPIFDGGRSNASARDIPDALFAEVASLRDGLQGAFRQVFDAEKMSGDRLLNWLMRSIPSAPLGDLHSAAERGVVLMGDAVHAAPILGGEGANEALRDGVALTELIARQGTAGLDAWYSEERLGRWRESVESGERRLEEMHAEKKGKL